MTQPILNLVQADSHKEPRPGTRAARMRHPLAKDVLHSLAEAHNVCVRPLAIRRTDTTTGLTEVIEVPCGARLASKCKPCAERNRRLRIQQIREGWHLAQEPTFAPDRPGDDVLSLVRLRAHLEFERAEAERAARWDELPDLDETIEQVEEVIASEGLRGHIAPKQRKAKARKTRSTKRRTDTPDLPRLPVVNRTIGRVYAGRDGRTYRPSMLVTLTLGSYGPVHTSVRRGAHLVPCQCGKLHGQADEQLGTPIDPTAYDYRRAALDAIHFARVLDRWWQNLRRAVGWNVQYAGCIELQRRLAPHAHFAIRGALPRRLLKQVAAATYHQVWWPPFDHPTYTVDKPPTWNPDRKSYVDPRSGEALQTWGRHSKHSTPPPAYVARLGTIDPREVKGVQGGTKDAQRCIRYVTKYVTKDIAEQANPRGDAQRAHFDRLHEELSTLPCSPTCANWLLYGVQPDKAKPGLVPDGAPAKSTSGQRSASPVVGCLSPAVVRQDPVGPTRRQPRVGPRGQAGAVDGEHEDQADEQPRYSFELAKPGDPEVPPIEHRILRAISTRTRWRQALQQARQRGPDAVSENQDHARAA